ncbi:hypothetical protein PAXRUDRAFT_830877 [Paxillus rubicundulus Ve08.2h10]|uniref:Uncharacterized protein n=1 Tax=Paxillus rubicundulus Ve08.2h10 TaxID=930991 RepID=A0A0D0DSV5_9AGAM|nr:hypothetical protein PAXRUDRAFT_830877 [Paxillus rubicundulus Ve08.2h10]
MHPFTQVHPSLIGWCTYHVHSRLHNTLRHWVGIFIWGRLIHAPSQRSTSLCRNRTSVIEGGGAYYVREGHAWHLELSDHCLRGICAGGDGN